MAAKLGLASRMREALPRGLPPFIKQPLADLLCHPIVGTAIAAIGRDRIASGGLSIRTENPSISARTKAQIFWGIYESAEIRFVRRHLRRDLDVLEVGSSLGVVSSHALSHLAPGRKLICVEANPTLIPTIEANLAANCPGREFHVINRALDYENPNGTTRLRMSGDTSASQLGRLSATEGNAGREVSVETTTIRKLVAEHGLRDYALISDIEGAEAGYVFAGADELAGCRQIILELHDTDHLGRRLSWRDLLAALVEHHGFRVRDGYGPVQVLER